MCRVGSHDSMPHRKASMLHRHLGRLDRLSSGAPDYDGGGMDPEEVYGAWGPRRSVPGRETRLLSGSSAVHTAWPRVAYATAAGLQT